MQNRISDNIMEAYKDDDIGQFLALVYTQKEMNPSFLNNFVAYLSKLNHLTKNKKRQLIHYVYQLNDMTDFAALDELVKKIESEQAMLSVDRKSEVKDPLPKIQSQEEHALEEEKNKELASVVLTVEDESITPMEFQEQRLTTLRKEAEKAQLAFAEYIFQLKHKYIDESIMKQFQSDQLKVEEKIKLFEIWEEKKRLLDEDKEMLDAILEVFVDEISINQDPFMEEPLLSPQGHTYNKKMLEEKSINGQYIDFYIGANISFPKNNFASNTIYTKLLFYYTCPETSVRILPSCLVKHFINEKYENIAPSGKKEKKNRFLDSLLETLQTFRSLIKDGAKSVINAIPKVTTYVKNDFFSMTYHLSNVKMGLFADNTGNKTIQRKTDERCQLLSTLFVELSSKKDIPENDRVMMHTIMTLIDCVRKEKFNVDILKNDVIFQIGMQFFKDNTESLHAKAALKLYNDHIKPQLENTPKLKV